MNVLTSFFAYLVDGTSVESAKLPLLKTSNLENSGNLSNNVQPQQSSTSPRNNLQLVSSITDVLTTYDLPQQTTLYSTSVCETVLPEWKVCKVDNFSSSSINSMQPNRVITSFVLKNRKQYYRNINFDSSVVKYDSDESNASLSSLNANSYKVDDFTLVRSMKSIQLETIRNGNANNFSYSFTMKNQEVDSSNFHLYSSLPISSMSHACYFEVTLVECNSNPTICLGFGKYDTDLQNHVGWFCESVALHVDDQRLRNSQRNSMYRVGGPQISKGDTIGVYWDLNSGMIYFTKNGEFIDYKTNCNVSNSNEFMIAMSGQVNGNSTLTFKLNIGNERFQCKHFNDLYHLSECQTKISTMINSEKLSDIFVSTMQ